MTRDEILNKIAMRRYGKYFNQLTSLISRAYIMQQAIDELLEQINTKK